MPKVTINDRQGLKVTAGSGVELVSDTLVGGALYTGNVKVVPTTAPGTTLTNTAPVQIIATDDLNQIIVTKLACFIGTSLTQNFIVLISCFYHQPS